MRTLLGGLAACACGNVVEGGEPPRIPRLPVPVLATRGTGPARTWRVRAEPVDEYVQGVVLNVLSSTTLADLVTPPPHVDTAGLRAEAAAIRRNLDELAADRALGLITRAQMLDGHRAGERPAGRDRRRAGRGGGEGRAGPVRSVAGAGSRRGARAWDELDLSRRREVIRALATVTLLPAGRGAREFDVGPKVRVESAGRREPRRVTDTRTA